MSVVAQQTLKFTVSASDPNPGHTLTYSLGPGAPPGASINPGTGEFTWTPTQPGVYVFTVFVTDNGTPPLPVGQKVTLTVRSDTLTIDAPMTISVPDRQVNASAHRTRTHPPTHAPTDA